MTDCIRVSTLNRAGCAAKGQEVLDGTLEGHVYVRPDKRHGYSYGDRWQACTGGRYRITDSEKLAWALMDGTIDGKRWFYPGPLQDAEGATFVLVEDEVQYDERGYAYTNLTDGGDYYPVAVSLAQVQLVATQPGQTFQVERPDPVPVRGDAVRQRMAAYFNRCYRQDEKPTKEGSWKHLQEHSEGTKSHPDKLAIALLNPDKSDGDGYQYLTRAQHTRRFNKLRKIASKPT